MVRLLLLLLMVGSVGPSYSTVKYSETFSQIDWEKIRIHIAENDVVIRMITEQDSMHNKQYQAVVFRKKNKSPRIIQMLKYPTVCYNNEDSLKQLLDSLSKWFILSLSKEITDSISRIYYIPTGILCEIPFEYGNITKDTMLSERYVFFRISSEFELFKNIERDGNKKMLICGGIDFRSLMPDIIPKFEFVTSNKKIGNLEYSNLTIEHNITNETDKEILVLKGENATENAFKTIAQTNVGTIVIETHGLFLNNYNLAKNKGKDDPMKNHALAFAGACYALEGGIVPDSIDDGILTAKEISELDLHNVDLAVVSACKSALGEIRADGVYGLMRGFKQAGVKSLIMATDDIVDYVSGQLWIQLFRNLAKGMTKREALLEGLKYIRTMDDGAFSHPKYWTPFILIDGMD